MVSIFVSWNGDTNTDAWQILAGEDGGPLEPVASAGRRGFETRIDLETEATRFKIKAIENGQGNNLKRVLSTTPAFGPS